MVCNKFKVLTGSVPLGPFHLFLAPQAFLDVGERVAVCRQHLLEQRDVCDGQPQRVNLAEALLVGERGHVAAQLVERRVDAAEITRTMKSYLVDKQLIWQAWTTVPG